MSIVLSSIVDVSLNKVALWTLEFFVLNFILSDMTIIVFFLFCIRLDELVELGEFN